MKKGATSKNLHMKPPKQRWGAMIAALRRDKGWTQSKLCRRYHIVAAKRFGDNEEIDYSIDQVWLRRVESGVRVTNCERFHIELLVEALNGDVIQRWDILQAAGYDFFADMNGNVAEVDKVFKRLFTQLFSSKQARRTVQRWLFHNKLDSPDWQDLLIAMIQAVDEERQGPSILLKQPAPA